MSRNDLKEKIAAVLLVGILALGQPFSSAAVYAEEAGAEQTVQEIPETVQNADPGQQETDSEQLITDQGQQVTDPVIPEEISGPAQEDGAQENDSQEEPAKKDAAQENAAGSGESTDDTVTPAAETPASDQAGEDVQPGTEQGAGIIPEDPDAGENAGNTENGEDGNAADPSEPDEKENEEDVDPFAGLRTIADLWALPENTAEGTTEYLGKDAPRINDRGWAANIYYVCREDSHNADFTSDFNLKYQMEFRSSIDMAPGAVEIRLPLSFFYYGEGDELREVLPAKVGLPQGTREQFIENPATFFNFYIDENSRELVFFNYTEIMANTVSAWQVVYENVEAEKVQTGTRWSVLPAVAVASETGIQGLADGELLPLTGSVEFIEKTAEEEEGGNEEGAADGSGLITADEPQTIEELKEVPEDTAEAVSVEPEDQPEKPDKKRMMKAAGGKSWSYNIYYINQENPHYVYKTDDFNLKYQMEFHNSVDIEQYGVQIRVPLSPVPYGHPDKPSDFQNEPNDIGIPQGSYDSETGQYVWTEARKSGFNYYIDRNTNTLVFFNYKKLEAGSDNAWQVLYRNYSVMEIEDGTHWIIDPAVGVTVFDEVQTLDEGEITPLEGDVNTNAALTSVTKQALNDAANYSPGLYTKNQVLKYAPGADKAVIPNGDEYGSFPGAGEKLFDHFDEYDFVVWKIAVTGYATQPYDLTMRDWTYGYADGLNGFIVGMYEENDYTGGPGTELPKAEREDSDYPEFLADYDLASFSKNQELRRYFYAVTAYPKGLIVPNQTVLNNHVECTLTPYDRKDDPTTFSADANWTYVDYNWKYSGDTIGVRKEIARNELSTLDSWRTVYSLLPEEESLSTSRFTVHGTCRSFSKTHHIDSTEGTLGEYIPGKYVQVTTVDDAVYAFPQDGSQAGGKYLLGKEDYYFNSAAVTIRDQGFDVYEDAAGPCVPDEQVPEGLDRGVVIEAMFARNADGSPAQGDVWEPVGTVAWNKGGSMTYTFSAADLAREPWRIKAVHNSVDYVTYSDFDLGISIRRSSPVFSSFSDAENVRLENIAGIAGEEFAEEGSLGYFQDQNTAGRYSEPGLLDLTQYLYQTVLMRDAALITLKGRSMHASARKQGKAYNDPANARVKIRYLMDAFEGYRMYAEEAAHYLKESGLPAPDRKDVVFYDLLPYGVQFDPSGKVTAGRMTSLPAEYAQNMYENWNTNQVEVRVDPDKDVIRNYNGTGRTRVAFHIHFTGRDSSAFARIGRGENSASMWFTGFGLAFDAYCDYEDYSAALERPNIVAYMPDDGNAVPILGSDNEVSYDDGRVVSSDADAGYYQDMGADINRDGVLDSHNVLYAKAQVLHELALGSPLGIKKYVRADDDPFGEYKKSTTVMTGDGYEYKITVTNASLYTAQDVVVFDRLENAINDRQEQEPGAFEAQDWKGTFESIITGELNAREIAPVIYYNSSRDAVIPEGATSLQQVRDILTEENGWKLYTPDTPAEDVRAVALDLSTKTDGSPFVMQQQDSVSFRIRMRAPEEMPENAVWAYNNPGFYSFQNGVNTGATVFSNSVKVKLIQAKRLELEKKLAEGTPESRSHESFRFYLKWNDGTESYKYSYKEYKLYVKNDDGEWLEQAGLRATDAYGALDLADGEKAVFEDVDAECIEIEEEPSLRWTLSDPELKGTIKDGVRVVEAVNTYHPLFYVTKNVTGYSQKDIPEINVEPFKMKLTDANGDPVAGKELYVVNRALLNGEEPILLDGSHKLFGNLKKQPPSEGTRVLRTDSSGVFDIYPDETVVFRMDEIGNTYTVTELEPCYSEKSAWICDKPSLSAQVGEDGNAVAIKNQYRWKDLVITKTVDSTSEYDTSKDTFTFRIYEAAGSSVEDKGEQLKDFVWQVVDSLSAEPDVNGWKKPAEDGSITAACAGKVLRVNQFRTGTRLIVEEVLSGDTADKYEIVRGSDFVVIPKYATAGRAEIENKYLYQDLAVSKTVVTQDPDADYSGRKFTMCLETAPAGTEEEDAFVPAVKTAYTLYDAENKRIYNYESGQTTEEDETQQELPLLTDAEGCFTLEADQTARFTALGKEGSHWRVREKADEDFPPIRPKMDEDGEYSEYLAGIFGEENQADFFNGDGDILIIRKKWVGDDDGAQAYLDYVKYNYNSSLYTNIQLDFDGAPVEVARASGMNYDGSSSYEYGTAVYVPHQAWCYSTEGYMVLRLPPALAGRPEIDFNAIDFTISESYVADEYGNIRNQRVIYGQGDFNGQNFVVNPDKDSIEITGTPGEMPIVTVENHLASYNSAVQKRMAGGDVPAGAELIWRVEQYENGAWKPAEGVGYYMTSYTITDNYVPGISNASPVPQMTGETGADGLVRIKTAETFYASDNPRSIYPGGYGPRIMGSVAAVMFDRKVYVNHYRDVAEGDYRVVELLKESDEAWGFLDSYITSPVYSYGYTSTPLADSRTATGFLNTRRVSRIRVEKIVDQPGSTVFTFTLQEYPHMLDNETLVPGSGLHYTVYDTKTGEIIRTGITTGSGQLTLQGGQYAMIDVAPSSRWRVTEEDAHPYHLEKVTVSGDGRVLSGNSAEVSLAGDPADMAKSDMLRVDFASAVTALADGNAGNVRNIIFGKTSDYPEAVSGTPVVMDSKGVGTILGYRKANASGGYDIYVLSDNLMYTHYNSSFMFLNLTGLESIRFSNVDTGKTTNMAYMFHNCWNLRRIDGMENWNTSRVTDMENMFNNAYRLESFDISSWDVSNVTNMRQMFLMYYQAGNGGSSFTNLDLSAWNTARVTDMSEMFSGCNRLENIKLDGSWDTSSVTDMSRMFNYCYNLKNVEGTGSWNTANVTDMSYMFSGCNALSSLDVSRWNTGNVISMEGMFSGCYNLSSLDVSNWDTGNVTTMSSMFSNCNRLASLEVSRWKTGNVTNMSNMFNDCRSLASLDVSNWDTGNVTDMAWMFSDCNGLTALDVSRWNTERVTDMRGVFNHCEKLSALDASDWKTGNVKYMSNMFSGCSSLETLDVSNWNTANVEEMSNMFSGCSNLKTLNAANWNTGKVNRLSSIFSNCTSLETLDVSNWNTGNVEDMSYVFYNCSSLTSLDVSNWRTDRTSNMSNMFSGCSSLESLDLSEWNTARVSSMNRMFSGCSNLKTLNIKKMSIPAVRYGGVSYMFNGCSALQTIICNQNWAQNHDSSIDNNNWYGIEYHAYMFNGCSSLPGYASYGSDLKNAYPGRYFTAE